jgi:hypothetical protein
MPETRVVGGLVVDVRLLFKRTVLSFTSRLCVLIVVVVPDTVRLPPIVRSPVMVPPAFLREAP